MATNRFTAVAERIGRIARSAVPVVLRDDRLPRARVVCLLTREPEYHVFVAVGPGTGLALYRHRLKPLARRKKEAHPYRSYQRVCNFDSATAAGRAAFEAALTKLLEDPEATIPPAKPAKATKPRRPAGAATSASRPSARPRQ